MSFRTSSPRLTASTLFVSILLLACISLQTGQAAKKTSNQDSTIYVIRGGGGYFPNLGTVINQKFEAKGLHVVDFRYHERFDAAKQMAQAYRNKQLPSGIIMIGYSLGGVGVLEVANLLKQEGIPVRLLFLIETINPMQMVPSNVQECFNLYHFPAVLGSSVKAESSNTKLTNFEAYSDGKLGLNYSHFTMPFVPEVHELIASRLVNAIQTKAPRMNAADRTASAQQNAVRTPGRSSSGVGASVEKKNPFAEFFGRSAEVPASSKVDPAATGSKKTASTTKTAASGKDRGTTSAESEKKNPLAEFFGVKSTEVRSTDQAKMPKANSVKKGNETAKITTPAKGKTASGADAIPEKKNPLAEFFGIKSTEAQTVELAKGEKANSAKKGTDTAKANTAEKGKTASGADATAEKKNPLAEFFGVKSKSNDHQTTGASVPSKKN